MEETEGADGTRFLQLLVKDPVAVAVVGSGGGVVAPLWAVVLAEMVLFLCDFIIMGRVLHELLYYIQ